MKNNFERTNESSEVEKKDEKKKPKATGEVKQTYLCCKKNI